MSPLEKKNLCHIDLIAIIQPKRAGMYASQVWGTVYLSEGSEFGSQLLQKRHLCSLRRILGVKNSTTNWAVLRECSQEPLQFIWFRASSIRLFNSMLDSNSETLRRVLKADLHLASFDSSCWSAQVSNAFNGLQGSAMFKQKMLSHTGSHARVHLRFAFQTFEGMEGS